jgi:hypothetical protein
MSAGRTMNAMRKYAAMMRNPATIGDIGLETRPIAEPSQ